MSTQPSTSDRTGILGAGSSQLEVTPREQQVVDLIGAGLSYKHAGKALGVTEKTVSVYVSNIGARIPGQGDPKGKIIAWSLLHGGSD